MQKRDTENHPGEKTNRISEADKHKLLVEFNNTEIDFPQDATLLDLFDIQVERNPDKTAVVFKNKEFTYAELNHRANQLSDYLRTNYDVNPDHLICMKLERSERMIITILGILKSGGAYVPIDPGYPKARIEYIEKDSGCSVIIDEDEFSTFEREKDQYSEENRPSSLLPGNLAYVIYTSGSTGQPKGCMLEHRGVINRIEWMWNKYNFTENDVILQKTTNTFDVSVWELFMPLCWGAKMVLCEPEDISSPDRIIKLIKTQKVTCLHFVPSMLNTFMRIGFGNTELKRDLASLKRVITSGEALSVESVKRWYGKLDIVIQNLYGPTEASVDVTYFETSKDDEIIPIGKPIDNTQIYILDNNRMLTPIGEMGEICIGGVGLARGYLNKPELTAEKFVPNPFRKGDRIYKTGDLGRFLPDGNVEYMGRKDDQVKVRGFRIELGEIESVLEKHELIDEVVVLAKEDGKGDKELIMYYVPNIDAGYTIRKILENKRDGLPDNVELNELPNGISLYTYNKSELKFLFEEIFEDKIYFKHGIHIPDDGCVVDIGANLGMFTVCSNFAAKNVSVYSFEPLPPIFQLLKLNSFLYPHNTKLFNFGISNKEETATFQYYPNVTILSSRYSEEKDVAETVKQYIYNSKDYEAEQYTEEEIQNLLKDRLVTENFECKLKPLSQVIREENLDKIDLLKIDVEKSELDVLEGISDNDWGKIGQVVMEVHDSDNRLARITHLLEKHDFEVFVEQNSVVNETKLYDLFAVSADSLSEKPMDFEIEHKDRYALNGLRESIKRFSKDKLPEYMIPSFFVELEEMPLTPNGKADRKSLLTLASSSVIYQDYVAPESEVEKTLVNIWQSILGIDNIGVKDNFFELGGHSLKAAQVVNQVHEAGYQLELKDFMTHKTIQKIARVTAKNPDNAKASKITRIKRDKEYYAITKTQRELWLLDKLDDSKRGHNILFRCDFEKNIDIKLLTEALTRIFEHYECFHSIFPEKNQGPVQKILECGNVKIPIVKDELNNAIDALKKVKIDIEKGPLFFPEIVEQSKHYTLLVNIHHIIFDGWSLSVFMEKIREVYQSLLISEKRHPDSLNDDIQNVDVAEWQKTREVYNAGQLDFWRDNLKPFAPTLNLPTKADRPETFTTNGLRHWFHIDKQLTTKLNNFAKEHSVTLFSVLLATYKRLLSKYSQHSDIVVGTSYANRKSIQQESLIGYYSNMIAIRTSIGRNDNFIDLVRSVNNNAVNAFSNSDISFGDVVNGLEIPADNSRTPVYQAMFIMQNWHSDKSETTLAITQKELGVDSSKTDITLNAEEIENGMEFWFEYNTDLFDDAFVTELKNEYLALLSRVEKTHTIECVNRKTCFIITETTLGVTCAEKLLESGFHIYGMISPSKQVQKWANDNAIFSADFNKHEIAALLKKYPYEYLFCIVSGILLDPEILNTPARCAMNYHDSLLPEYAGMHATAWAIMNGEKTHGVTWHEVAAGVDTGDIVQQASVQVDPDETSLTLNAKCYAAAARCFDALVDDILEEKITLRRQDLDKRTYYPLYQRPPAGGLISWNDNALDIDARVRALDFGGYENPLGTAKIATGQTVVIVTQTALPRDVSGKEPGTVIAIDPESMTVSTGTGDLTVTSLKTIDGAPLAVSEWVSKENLFVGKRLHSLDPALTASLETMNAELCRYETFWVRKMAGLKPLQLPFKKAVAPGEYEKKFVTIPVETTCDIDLLPAAFSAYLARFCQTDSFDLGIKHRGLSDAISGLEWFFSPYVPLHIRMDWDLSFGEFKKTFQDEIDRIDRRKTFPRDLAVRYPELSKKALHAQGCPFTVAIEQAEHFSDFAATTVPSLRLVISHAEKACRLVYDPRVYEAADVQDLVDRFVLFLGRIMGSKDLEKVDLKNVSLLTDQEYHRQVVEWNDTKQELPEHLCVHHLFEARAAETPEVVAVERNGKGITYGELNVRANRLARHLRKMGVTPEMPVGICVDRSFDMITGILGILKAGGAYLPLDPKYPLERIFLMLNDSNVSMVLSQGHLREQLLNFSGQTVLLDDDWERIENESPENPAHRTSGRNLAYVIYTSGSTGKPKGVMALHRGVVNHAMAVADRFDVGSHDRVAQFFSISFDGAVEEIFMTLTRGATLVLLPFDPIPSMSVFMEWIEKNGITVLDLPSAFWHEWMHWLGDSEMPLPASLRAVIVGGEKASESAFSTWRKHSNGRVRWFNTYGPTETTVVSTISEPGVQADTSSDSALSIGRPIANTLIYVVDQNLLPVPVGMPGELLIGGAGVAGGYLNRPGLTALKFIQNPFIQNPFIQNPFRQEGLLYKTGDQVRYLPDGNIDFIGRLDQQAKIRGFRIEPGEIEAALGDHPAVGQAVVAVREDPQGEKRLMGYVVLKKGATTTPRALKQFLKQKLPAYMVPSAVVLLKSLPRLPNGKVDHSALPEPEMAQPIMDGTFVPPETPLEKQLATLWESVLGVERVGIRDHFFELGGHSLMAVRLCSEIEKRIGRRLPLQTLFQAPTIAKLVKTIEGGEDLKVLHSLVEIQPPVEIQPGKGKTPLFFIHVLGAGLGFCSPLAAYLGKDQPVYGLSVHLPGGRLPVANRVEDLARHYVKEMRVVQPEGPYLLAGISFGGMVGYEMAQQLRQSGETSVFLALIDTSAPGGIRYGSMEGRIWEHWKMFRKQGPSYVLEKLIWRIRRFQRSLQLLGFRLRRVYLDLYEKTGRPLNASLRDFRARSYNKDAMERYVPRAYDGNLILFRSQERILGAGAEVDPNLGWGGLAKGGISVYEVPSGHLGMLREPHVRFVGKKMRTCMDRSLREFHLHSHLSPDE